MQQLSPEKYIVTKGATLPFYEALINNEWQQEGLADIVISKKMPSGKLIVGLYLVDTFCLGLKSTLFKFGYDEIDYEALINKLSEQHQMVKCELNFVHNLIYGAIDYAKELGFVPDKDFKITENLLNPGLIDDGIDEIEFGKDGKPFFIAGPNDDVDRIIGLLRRNAGEGNYDYVIQPD